jgi:P pilus assembly chaperone PapD
MVITEVPSTGPDTHAGIRFALRLSLPVFITPRNASAAPVWELNGNGRDVEVRNEGNAHLHVRRLVIRDQEGGGVLAHVDSPSYVLAREVHSWPDLLPAGTGPVLVEAETNLGALSIALER